MRKITDVMKETLRKIHTLLDPMYGRGEADAMTRMIFEAVKGWTPVDMIVYADKELSDFNREEIDAILRRLAAWEPIQYILGYADFYGMRLKIKPGVLIPRPETAQLVDFIVKENPRPDMRVLDICTGSGCIALALSRFLKFPEVTAVDNSPEAIQIAQENARTLKCRVKFILADIFVWTPAPDSLDIIVANPPYVDESEKVGMETNVLRYEPADALFVPDENPLLFYSRIAEVGFEALHPGGKLYFEINPRHSDAMKKLLEDIGYVDIRIERDMFGKNRFAMASKNYPDD